MKAKGRFLITILCTLYSVFSFATSYTWNGATSTAWATTTNWTPNGTPGSGDNVTVVSATNAPLYDGVAGVTNLTMTSGTLNLNGYTLNVTGTGTFDGGIVSNGKINATGTTTTFAGTIFSCKLRAVVGNFSLSNTIFNDSTYIEKTGSSSSSGTGGNKFNAFTEIVSNGSGAVNLGFLSPYSPDSSTADIKFTKKSSATFRVFDSGTGHRFNGKVIIECTTSSGGIMNVGEFSSATFNGDIVIHNSIGADIRFAYSTGSNHTLLSGKKITIGGSGFSGGVLRMNNFTQAGSTRQTVALTGSSTLHLLSNVVFEGPVNFKAGLLNLNGAWFKDSLIVEQTVGSGSCSGSNVFDGPTTLINSGTGYLRMAASSPDTFNNSLSIINRSTSYIAVPNDFAGTYFGGNVTVKQTSGIGIYLGRTGTPGCTLSSGHQLITDTFNTGILALLGFKQLGSATQNITLTGSAYLYLYATSIFNGTVNVEAPNIYLHGAKFNGQSKFKKTGSVNNSSAGGNIFNDSASFIQDGAGYFLLGSTVPDTFNYAASFENKNNYTYVGYSSTGNYFGGNLHLKNTAGNGIYLNYTGTASYNGNIYVSGAGSGLIYFGIVGSGVLASGKTIIEGSSGLTAGTLYLKNFTKNGTTAMNLDIGNAAITFSTGSTLNGPVTVSAGAIYLNGTTFNGNVDILKTGTTSASSSGGNTFNGTFKLRLTSSGQIALDNSTTLSDVFNGDAEFINEGTGTGGSAGHMFLAYKGPANQFNGSKTIFTTASSVDRGIHIAQYGTCTFNSNIEVNNTSATSSLIDFGTYSGIATLASGKTISVGTTGFTNGRLYFRGFHQVGSTTQTITTTGTSTVRFTRSVDSPYNPPEFGGVLNVTAPIIELNGSIFNDDVNFTATGAYTVINGGGNEYKADFSFTNTGSGNKTFASSIADTYRGNAVFSSSSGSFYIAHAGVNTFSGDITVTGSPSYYFGNGGGKVVMDGAVDHKIKRINGSETRTFSLNKPGDYTSDFKNLLFSNDLMGRMWQQEN